MASASQEIANQLSLLEAQQAVTEMGFFSFSPNTSFPPPPPPPPPPPLASSQQSLKPFFCNTPPPDFCPETVLFSLRPTDDHLHLLSLQRSSPSTLWAWGDMGESFPSRKSSNGVVGDGGDIDRRGRQLRVSTTMKKIKGRKKVREPRFCFKTMSDVDVLDDGYKWRKYGQKVVKNTLHPRSYYRCTQDNCRVKKRVERLAEDPRMVITTYEGRHAHSPSHDSLDETTSQLPSSHLNNFFW